MERTHLLVLVSVVSIFLLCAGCISPNSNQGTNSPTTTLNTQNNNLQTSKVWSDANIGLLFNGIKRVNSFSSGKTQPKPGNDVVIVNVSVSFINNVTVVDLGSSYTNNVLANLITDKGNSYSLVQNNIQNLRFLDPNHPFSGKLLIPSSLVNMEFEIPLSEQPVKIIVPYEYYEGENKSKLLVGKIEITIK
jgi:hypothetical protein